MYIEHKPENDGQAPIFLTTNELSDKNKQPAQTEENNGNTEI